MTKVLLDGQAFSLQRRGGVARVMGNIYGQYLKKPETRAGVQIRFGIFAVRYSDIHEMTNKRVFIIQSGRGFAKLLLITNWFYLWVTNYDILHSTHYFRPYLFRKRGSKHVVTLHDMIPEDHPEYFPSGNPHFHKKLFLENADKIVCVSYYTKSRLAFHYPHLENRAVVVYPGVKKSNTKFSGIQQSYFLYVGDRGKYKDFHTLARAFSITNASNLGVSIFCVGGGEFSDKEMELFKSLRISSNIFRHDLSEEELACAYAQSLATVVTSSVEGFGLPVIEAMVHGSIVIASDIPVFKEIAGAAFVPFPQGDSKTLGTLMNDFCNNPDSYSKFRSKGREIAKLYTWEKMFEQLIEIYKELKPTDID